MRVEPRFGRRLFLQAAAATGVTLGLSRLTPLAPAANAAELADFMLSVSQASKGADLATLRRQGHVRIASIGTQGGTTGIYSDYSTNEPIVPMRWFVEKKQPYPTLAGRQQFHVDHRWFLCLDEALPRYKAPPAADYGHLGWSYAHYEPGQVDRDTRVEIERLV